MNAKILFGALVAVSVAACSSQSTPSPTAPTSPTVTVAALTVSSAKTSASTLQLSATARMSDGSTRDVTTTATWSSSNPSLATVSNTGLVTVTGTGELDVNASYQGATGTLHLFVATLPVAAVTVSGAPAAGSAVFQLTATARLSDGSTQDVTHSAAWSSSNTAVATVSGGYVTALGPGEVDITATYEGVPGSIHVSVATPKRYTVFGTVTEPAPGLRPISGARVQVLGGPFATTDAQGKYAIALVTEGRQLVEVTKDGYKTFEQEITITGDTQLNVTLTLVQAAGTSVR